MTWPLTVSNASSVGGVEDGVDEVGVPVVDRHLGAELETELRLLGRSRGGDDPRAGMDAELEGRRTGAARGRVDEQCLSGLDPGALVQGQPCEVKGHEDRGRIGLGHVGRHLGGHRGGRDDVFGIAAEGTGGDRDHAFPEPGLEARRDVFDDAQHFHTGDVGHRSRHRPVATVDPVEIIEVQRHRRDTNLQLTSPGLRHRDVVETQNLPRRAVRMRAS